MIDGLIPAFLLLTLHSYIGFKNRSNLSKHPAAHPSGRPRLKPYLSSWKFACQIHGDSWYNPKGILSKLLEMRRCGGAYRWEDGDIYLNLPAIYREFQKGSCFGRDYETDSVDELVEYVIEHEALHSAIRNHAGVEYQREEDEFKQEWRTAGRLEKTKMFFFSVKYGFGGGLPWNEEWVVEQVQDAKRVNRELQTIRREVELNNTTGDN